MINIEDSQVFESAIVNVAVFIGCKSPHYIEKNSLVVNKNSFIQKREFHKFVRENGSYYLQSDYDSKSWTLIKPKLLTIQRKIESKGVTLEKLGTKIRLGIATGSNEAFIISSDKRSELISKNPKNSTIIKPILRGRDIFRFYYENSDLYILLTKNGVNVQKDYPDIYQHLYSFGEDFVKRGAQGQHWTNLRACAFFDDFKKEKIIWIELTDVGRFALCKDEIYLLNSAYFLLPPSQFLPEYLLGILNSKVIRFYLGIIAETSGMGTSRWINIYVKEFPIPVISKEQQKLFVDLVRKITTAKEIILNASIQELETKLDCEIYSLYGLSSEEVKIIESEILP